MPADSSSLVPHNPNSGALAWRVSAAVLGLSLIVLFLAWPYQEWEFGYRMSVLGGWYKWVTKYPDWMFCLFVPAITGGVVWLRQGELRGIPWQGDWLGVLPLVLGLFLYWLGFKANTGYPAFLAIQFLLAGFILLIGGRKWMRALFFPWLFLFFAWPMQPLEDSMASPLRPRTAAMTATLLTLLGTPAENEGSALQSAPDAAEGLDRGAVFSLDVDAKCSGINSLFALMMIAALLGYFALRSVRSRLMLFIAAVPLAVAGNIIRLLLLAFGSIWFGSDIAVGKRIGDHQEMSLYHTIAGFAVFGVALAGMFALCWVFEGREMTKNLSLHHQSKSPLAAWPVIPLPRRTLAQAILILVLAATTFGICAATDTSYLVARAGVSLHMPLQVDGYQGREIEVQAREKKALDEGVKLVRFGYLNEKNRKVIASVILSGHLKRSLHRPEVCLPGQGWTIVETRPVNVPMAEGQSFDATYLRIFIDQIDEDGHRVRQRGVNLYWYVGSDDTTCASHYEHVAQTYLHAIFRNLNHRWAMVSIFIPVEDTDVPGPEGLFAEFNALEDARAFASQLMPFLTDPAKRELGAVE
jgi:exosortase